MAQKIDIVHRFECSAQKLYELMSDNDFDSQVMADLGIEKETLSATQNDEGPLYVTRVSDKNSVPDAFKSMIGDQLEYEETRQWHKATLGNDWKIKTAFMTDKVNVGGVTEIVDVGDGCERRVRGTVEIKIPLVGKKIESKILEALNENFEKNRVFMENYIKGM